MSEQIEAFLNGATEALRRREHSECETLCDQALSLLAEGDQRVPEALSLRGTARIQMHKAGGLDDLKRAVQIDPNEPQFQMALGQGFLALGNIEEAEMPLGQAFRMGRGHPAPTLLYARCLLALDKAFMAEQVLGPLVSSGRATPALVRQFAEAKFQNGDVFGARDILAQLFGGDAPEKNEDRLQLARLDLSLRDYETARVNIEAILADDPHSIDARISAIRLMDWVDDDAGLRRHLEALIRLKPERADALALIVDHSQELDPDTIETLMHRINTVPVTNEEEATLGFALALYFDRKKEFERAWDAASLTNTRIAAFRGATMTMEARQVELRRLEAQFERALKLYQSSGPVPTGEQQERFIYLIGAPRTGSSLLQSILAAPDRVVSLGERAALYAYLRDASSRDMETSSFERLASDLHKAERAGLERQGKLAPVLVDKTPHHAFVTGLLERVNPDARFVQVFRDAGDVALSMYLRPFPKFFAEATDPAAIADLLEFRLKLFEGWRKAGVDILPFSYERFTETPAIEGKRLFEAVGLDWDERYLDPSARPEAVPTFSSRQVRKPITAKPVPHWRSYQEFAPDVFSRLADISDAQKGITDTNL
ncbi:MAG: hypothetical protein CMK09_06580 [Ponticaulis sp.]|nr:hypothetical protein [Ponticaulis sp.]|tara:strand:+ start:536 stop:2338 length:1803 start_codon:yes stop_codon:yes gene_type:complete